MQPLVRKPARAPETPAASATSPAATPPSPFALPIEGAPVVSPFGDRRVPGLATWEPHQGVDLAATAGAEVRAAAAGRALFSGHRPGFGGLVVLDHAGGWQTVYGNLGARAVAVGEEVREGAVIGVLGAFCDADSGCCLHFEVRHDGAAQDPAPLIGAGP